MGIKMKSIFYMAGISLVSFSTPAWALDISMVGGKVGELPVAYEKIQQAVQARQAECDAAQGSPHQAQICQQSMDTQRCAETAKPKIEAVIAKYKGSAAANAVQNSSCMGIAASIGKAVDGRANESENAVSEMSMDSATCSQQKALLAREMSAVSESCRATVAQACSKVSEAQELFDSCRQIATASAAVSQDNMLTGGSLLDNALKATQLGLGLGQLGQMFAGQKGGNSNVSGAGAFTPEESTVDLGVTSKKSAGGSPGFGTKSSSVSQSGGSAGFSTGSDGFAPFSESRDFSAEAAPIGSAALTPESGISSPSIGGGSGLSATGGGGASDGSGSSKLGEVDPKANAAQGSGGDYEVGAGGGGSPSFLGLKSSGSEFGDMNKDLGLDTGLGADFDLERDIASLEQGALEGGINEDEGVSIFSVVHSKISEMKKRGSI